MGKGEYTIGNIYQGGYSAFDPNPLSKYFKTSRFALTTNPRTSNILQEVSSKLSSGVKNIELEMLAPDTFDNIPTPQLKEVHRLSKLTGINVSVHGPVIDTTGINQRGGGFSESERELAERKVASALLRSHDLDPKGNIIVNFHSGEGLPGSDFKTLGKDREAKRLIVVDRETGRLNAVDEENRAYPSISGVKEKKLSAEYRLDSQNKTGWDNSIFQIEVNRENAERIMQDIHPLIIARFAAANAGVLKPEEISKEEKAYFDKIHSAYEFTRQASLVADSLFDKAYRFAKEDEDVKRMNELTEAAKEYSEMVGHQEGEKVNRERYLNPKLHSQALVKLMGTLERSAPRSSVPIEEFAVKQSAKTYGNAAFEAYKKFKDTAPILTIENPPIGFALGTGQDVANLVEASREQFVKNAVDKLGMDEGAARKQAKKLIGATLDVGHMNMLRRQGFKEEDVVKEAQKMAPYLKHLHLSDNFGLEHTELPMGMGNVPLQKIMEKLKKEGVDFDKMRNIIEAGPVWWDSFGSPFYASLEGMGAPVRTTGVAPYWNQSPGFYQGYAGGLAGPWLPSINYESFGAGFTNLPSELGGSRQGAQGSRMSGRGME